MGTGSGQINIGSVGATNLSAETYNLALVGASSNVVFNGTGGLILGDSTTLTFDIGSGTITSPGAATADMHRTRVVHTQNVSRLPPDSMSRSTHSSQLSSSTNQAATDVEAIGGWRSTISCNSAARMGS